jgi:hypothetical protein
VRLSLVTFAILATAPYASVAMGGTLLEQSVEVRAGTATAAFKHTWRIDGQKFSLTVSSETSESRYIFNGRTLYVCSKLPKQEAAAVQELKNTELLASLQQGAVRRCRVIS